MSSGYRVKAPASGVLVNGMGDHRSQSRLVEHCLEAQPVRAQGVQLNPARWNLETHTNWLRRDVGELAAGLSMNWMLDQSVCQIREDILPCENLASTAA